MAISGREMTCPRNYGSALRIFFKLLLNERGQEVHESYSNGSFKKVLFGANSSFLGPKMARPNNYGSALSIFCKFCPMTGAQRYMKVWKKIATFSKRCVSFIL